MTCHSKVIVEDTRQQAGKHQKKHEAFEHLGVDLIRCKLPFGDYAKPPRVAVDTKADIIEIANNMCGSVKERRRFLSECKTAKEAGCTLIFLIEAGNIMCIEDLYGKCIPLHSGVTIPGDQLAKAMLTMSERYGCRFEFCKPSKAGERIIELLEGEP